MRLRFDWTDFYRTSRLWFGVAFLAAWCCLSARAARASFLLTAQNLTVTAGQSGTLNVTWSSPQTINYLNTQFVLRAVTGASGGAVFTETSSGVPPMPPITDPNYVFSGNSAAVTAGGNPASVGTDTWAADSYFLIDTTDDGLDALQNGSRLWTTLNITGVAAGTYQLRLLSSEYDYAATGGSAIPLTDSDLSGGLITVNARGGGGTVPEPSSGVVVAMLMAGTALRQWRKNRREAA